MNKKNKNPKSRNLFVYGTYIFIFSFIISMIMSMISQGFSSGSIYLSFFILFIVIAIGVIFDIIGVAITTCNPAPFHSMAAKKNKYAKFALRLLKKAPLVATVSQDVVGDISGIVSGALITSIAFAMVLSKIFSSSFFLNVILSSLVAGITVATKAICKDVAIKNSKNITLLTAKVIYKLNYVFTLKWLEEKKK